MNSRLRNLFDLRRDAEDTAKRALETASLVLVKEEEEQKRLALRWRQALVALDRETKRLVTGPGPSTVGQGHAREGYLARLRDEADRLKAAVEDHQCTALAAAQAARAAALAGYERASREREVVARLEQRARAARAKTAARNAEDAASDLVAHRRRSS
jgi:hypothetical protein